MSADVTVRIRFGRIPDRWRRQGMPAAAVRQAQRAAHDAAGPYVQRALAINTPVGATGAARAGVHYEPPFLDPARSFVGYTAPGSTYIGFANDGTRPHTPPWQPIYYWATRKGANPGAVFRSIQKRGTRAQRFIEKTVDAVRGPASELMKQAAIRVLRRMGD